MRPSTEPLASHAKGTARANHWFAKTPGGFAVAKFQAVGNKTLGAEIFGHRTEDVLEKLADEDDAVAVTDRFNQFVHSFTAHFGFQFVLKVFFAKEIEAISGDAAEDAVKQAGGKGPAGEICRGTQEAHRERSDRRTQRSRKLWLFQLKNPTLRNALISNSDPSTRQYVTPGTRPDSPRL